MALSGFSPSTPFPRPLTGDAGPQQQSGDQGDGLDDMSKSELVAMADGLGLGKTGNKSDLIERIREHRMQQHDESQGAPTPDEDADQTGADANPKPDHDGVNDPDERDDPYGDETATIGD